MALGPEAELRDNGGAMSSAAVTVSSRTRAREGVHSMPLSRARARRPALRPPEVLRRDVLDALLGQPGTLDRIALNVRARKADVVAALRELEGLGLAVGHVCTPGTAGGQRHRSTRRRTRERVGTRDRPSRSTRASRGARAPETRSALSPSWQGQRALLSDSMRRTRTRRAERAGDGALTVRCRSVLLALLATPAETVGMGAAPRAMTSDARQLRERGPRVRASDPPKP